jgi:hypothetical protein
VPPTPPAFIVQVAVVDRTEATNPGLVYRYFNQPNAFQSSNTTISSATPNATHTVNFADETKLEAAITNGTLPADTGAVIYDCECWPGTPLDQQHDPAPYYQRAADAVQGAGLTFIATPATDLANGCNPGSNPDWERYLSGNIPALAAKSADIYEIQSQKFQADLPTYTSYVQQAAAQALAANPDVSIMAGLTTNHNGVEYTGADLIAAARAVQNDVWGWWINDPVSGTSGPCPNVVVDFLASLHTIGY